MAGYRTITIGGHERHQRSGTWKPTAIALYRDIRKLQRKTGVVKIADYRKEDTNTWRVLFVVTKRGQEVYREWVPVYRTRVETRPEPVIRRRARARRRW